MTEPVLNETPTGQLEIAGLDTPLGQKAESYFKCLGYVQAARDDLYNAKTALLEEMESSSKSTFSFDGKTISRVKGTVKEDTIRISS